MSAYIARSALATLLLDLAQSREPSVRGLWLEFATMTSTECNWRVSQIEAGCASELAATAAVDQAVHENTAWVMVEDGDPRDGDEVGSTLADWMMGPQRRVFQRSSSSRGPARVSTKAEMSLISSVVRLAGAPRPLSAI